MTKLIINNYEYVIESNLSYEELDLKYKYKHLLFSNKRNNLILAAEYIKKYFNLKDYRISIKSSNNGVYSYVCSIYADGNKLDFQSSVAMYIKINNFDVAYRGTKSIIDTLNNKYSNAFKNSKICLTN